LGKDSEVGQYSDHFESKQRKTGTRDVIGRISTVLGAKQVGGAVCGLEISPPFLLAAGWMGACLIDTTSRIAIARTMASAVLGDAFAYPSVSWHP
jgi:hypothetical protein